jgi:hypothetical protein
MTTQGFRSGRISTSTHSPIRLFMLASLLALGAAVLAGCGGGGDDLGLLGAAALQRTAPGDAPAAEPER